MNEKLKYNDFIIKDNFIQKIYYLHIHQTLVEKIFDIILFLGILTVTILYTLEYYFDYYSSYLSLLSIFLMFLFVFELFREYARSFDTWDFIRRHWIDISILLFITTLSLITTYVGFSKWSKLIKILKNIKILVKSH